MFTVILHPLVAAVGITAAKEGVKWRNIKNNKEWKMGWTVVQTAVHVPVPLSLSIETKVNLVLL